VFALLWLLLRFQLNRDQLGISGADASIRGVPLTEFRGTDPASRAGGEFNSIPHRRGCEVMPVHLTTSGCSILIKDLCTRGRRTVAAERGHVEVYPVGEAKKAFCQIGKHFPLFTIGKKGCPGLFPVVLLLVGLRTLGPNRSQTPA
jgi:hypothetical protein